MNAIMDESREYYCTYFDHGYLPRAMIMLESILQHASNAYIFALCLSDECYRVMQALAYPRVTLIPLAELEDADKDLLACKDTRSLVEYYFTITPCLPWYLLRQYDLPRVTYLDADMAFFGNPNLIFAEEPEAKVIITPHRFLPALKHLETHGLYNVSWLTFTKKGLDCLAWYRKSCLDWCHDYVDGERFADQKYLDQFQKLFDLVHIIEHPGSGLAPWNLNDALLTVRNKNIFYAEKPLVFYHYQGFKHLWASLYDVGLCGYQRVCGRKTKTLIYRPYIHAYHNAMQKLNRLLSGFAHPNCSLRSGKRNIITKIKSVTKSLLFGNLVSTHGQTEIKIDSL